MAEPSMAQIGELLQGVFTQSDGPRKLLEALMHLAMEQEITEHLKARRHERSGERSGYRNGYKPRTLGTRVGELTLQVPQARGTEPYHPSLFARYQRHERALLVACAEMYFQGVSTAKVQQVLEAMGAQELSAMSVSRIAAELDEQLEVFRNRSLAHKDWRYLMIDARYEKVRVAGHVVSQAMLVTAGFAGDGSREILDFRIADSESLESWGGLFAGLKDRGLKGLELVVSDAHGGIRAALARHFQGVAWQRCRVHFKRELAKQVGYKKLPELMRDIAGVYAGSDAAECRRRGQEMAQRWATTAPGVARLLESGLEDTLTVLRFPEHHQRRLASTNLLENLMKQLKARTRVVGIFPNRASCERLTGALLLERHESWQVETEAYFTWPEAPAAAT